MGALRHGFPPERECPAPYGPYNTVNFAKIPNPSARIGRNSSNSLNLNATATLTPTPSVGFASDVNGTGKTIVRGGFGTNYYVDPGVNAFSAVGAPPNLKVFSYYTGSGTPLTLATASAINPASNPGVVYGSASPTDHQPAVTYSWNLAVARVLPAAVHVEASYVANTTRHPNGYSTLNVVPLGSETTNNDGGPYFGGNHYQQLNRPYQNLRRHRRQRPQPQLQLQLPPVHRLAVQGLVHRLAYLHLRQGPRLQLRRHFQRAQLLQPRSVRPARRPSTSPTT